MVRRPHPRTHPGRGLDRWRRQFLCPDGLPRGEETRLQGPDQRHRREDDPAPRDQAGDAVTWADAVRRVETLKHAGQWPGIIGPLPDGTYRLTIDPETP